MKTLIKSTLLASLLIGTISCEKAVEKTPTHLATLENAYKTVADYENSLSSVYNSLRGVGYYGRNMSVIPDMMADNLVQTPESLVNFLALTDWVVTPGNANVAETWIGAYGVVNNANIIINNIDKVATAANQSRVNRIKGQCLAIRAMVHFDVLKYWADNLDRSSTSLGIPYIKLSVLEASPVGVKPTRISVKEVYDNIYADIAAAKTAFATIDAPINPATNRYKVDLVGLNAIEARVALYAKDYTTAINASTVVINALPLASRAVFPNIFRDQSNTEVAFSVLYNTGEFLSRLGGDVFGPTINRSQWEGDPALFAQIDETNDVRFAVNVRRGYATLATPVRGTSRLVVVKHLGKGTAIDGVVDWKAFRTGEMYLIRAEARARSNQDALALADLNALRAARINGFVAGIETGATLINAIELERRKELFMEGHRWFDLKRTTRSINRGTVTAPTTQSVLAPTRKEWIWPIPTGELDANPNMAQNTGY
jgi:starch-binding outer membrane protein, SusD/RagB family